jgi:hypothetical protein
MFDIFVIYIPVIRHTSPATRHPSYPQFGKMSSSQFSVDIRAPLTPFVAFGFALSFFEL